MNDEPNDINGHSSSPMIPLDSSDPLWEWDTVTDDVFLSKGLIESLRFENAPRKMRDFYALLPPDISSQLIASRVGVLSGATGSVLDCSYLLNGQWVREYLMALTRDNDGRATRIIGRLTVAPLVSINAVFKNAADSMSVSGLWLYDIANRKLYRDSMCESILGLQSGSERASNIEAALESVHPDDLPGLRRHYALFCSAAYPGDHITDMIRVKGSDDHYINIMVRASALLRKEDGKAVLLGGIIAHNETEQGANAKLLRDDRLYHALNALGSGQWNWDIKSDVMRFCKRYLAILGYAGEKGQEFAKKWRDYIH
ncbi:MAG: PAS domain-containing protein, partial [Desulfovibrio sp.]|nr:PAS domain-containing protein [Desulfovibrio sp.]